MDIEPGYFRIKEEAMQQEAITQFKGQLRGELIEPTDARYEEARKVYNAMISRKPRLIARCADVADVITAVRFGQQQDLRVSIRGGGHNAGGLGVCDDGLVIDLSLIKYVHVDPAARTVRVGGGCTWGDVDHATHAFGLAVPSGIISTTGVGGLTLGGGMGHLTRQYGLTIDNLLAADVVLADGSVCRGERRREQRPVLGDSRRWRKLRRRHVVSLPGASRAYGVCRADVVGPGSGAPTS